MILVILGTQDKSFKRLLDEIQKLINNGIIKEEVVVQAGFTKYESSDMKIFDYISKDDLIKYIKMSNLMIVHGGVGTIMDGLKNNKKIIAIPRLKEYKEHVNDHQIEIVEEFDKRGLIIGVNKENEIEEAIKKSIKFKPEQFVSNNKQFIKLIEDYID